MNALSTFVIILTVIPAWAQEPPKIQESPKAEDTQPSIAQALAQQRASVAAMEASLAVQRAAIAAQRGEKTPPNSFFLLPPPTKGPIMPLVAPKPDCEQLPATQIDGLVEDAARRENLEPAVLRGIIKQESGFSPCAVSPKGAMGLMQLMPATATQFGVKDPFNPKDNVDAGAKLFKQLLTSYGDLQLALAAYNAGPGNVTQAGGVPKFQETREYIKAILAGLPVELLGIKH